MSTIDLNKLVASGEPFCISSPCLQNNLVHQLLLRRIQKKSKIAKSYTIEYEPYPGGVLVTVTCMSRTKAGRMYVTDPVVVYKLLTRLSYKADK